MTVAEQPEDWTEPGAHPVVAGVHRVPLPIPSSGLHAVNAYVVESPDGPVVLDSGWAMPDTPLLPAHGPVTRSVHTRVGELLVHHEERLEEGGVRRYVPA